MSKKAPEPTIDYRPSLPDWGAYLRWPANDTAWIHSEDLDTATELLPSNRVLKREKWDGEFYWLSYGDKKLRVRPSLWTRVPDIDLEVGEQVELLHRQGENDPGIFHIHEIMFCEVRNVLEFYLRRDELVLERAFLRIDLQPLIVKHDLRAGFYEHKQPKSASDGDSDMLDVGDILG